MAIRFSQRYIVDRRYDLTYFVGGALVSLFFWGVFVWLRHADWLPASELTRSGSELRERAVLLTYFLFTALFDLPHIFQTASRTHLDEIERARHPHLYTWGLVLFVLVGFSVHIGRVEGPFIVGVAFFGSYHIVRQHVGLLRCYEGLNERLGRFDRALSRAALEVPLYACFIYHFHAVAGAPMSEIVPIYGELQARFPLFPTWIVAPVCGAALLLLVTFVARQLYLAFVLRRALNLPKLLLMGAALTVQVIVFFFARVPFLVAEAIETAYHDIQYQAWIAHYQRRRFPTAPRLVQRWLVATVLFGLVAGLVEVWGLADKRWAFLHTPAAMLTVFHYYIDSKIWKLRDAPELRVLVFGAEAPQGRASS